MKIRKREIFDIKRHEEEIHEMQISDRINDRSIFDHLMPMDLWLIVLLLCNYPEFAQGLESGAEGCGWCFV